MRTPRLSLGLRTRLILRVLLPLTVVITLAVTLAVLGLERELEARMQDEVELVARSLRLPLTHALELGRPGSVDQALQSALEIRRVFGVHVYGPQGDVVASHGEGWPAEPPERLSELAVVGERVGEYGRAGGRRVYSYFVPLLDQWGRSLGILQVTRRRQEIDDSVLRLRLQSAGLLLLGLGAVGVLVLRGHHRTIGDPLDRLRGSMRQVREGDRSHRAQVEGPRELAEVARSFNTMLEAIEEAEDELSARRAAQTELRRELAQTEKLAAVGELASGVAHELGSPLSVIDGRAQRMIDPAPGEMEGELRAIRGEVRRMERIIRQLLEFGRRDTGRRRSTELGGVVQSAASAVRGEAERRGVKVELDPAAPGPPVWLDRRQMEEALTNLLRNALQAVDGEGGVVRVRWGFGESDAWLVVEDDGPGIPPEIRSRILEPFFTTKPTGEGTGLGLAVVHGFAEAHGGRLEVGESPMGGARFRLVLPLGKAVTDEESAVTDEQEGERTPAGGRHG